MLPTLDRAFYRRLAVTAAVLIAYRLGCHLPVPGLDGETLALLSQSSGGATERLSLFALGIMPLLNALIFAEIIKLIAPSVRAWDRLPHIVLGLALVMALVQAGGVASALEEVTGLVPEPGIGFRVVSIATLMAGAALVMALAGIIDRAGLGSGVWLLFLTPVLAELPRNLAAIALLFEEGSYPLAAILGSAAFTVLAVAGVVRLMRAAPGSEATATTCAFTPLITYSVLSWLLFVVGSLFTLSVQGALTVMAPGNLVRYVALAAVVILVSWLYARSYRDARQLVPLPPAAIGLTLAAIAVAAELLQSELSTVLPLGSVQLVVAAVVATRMLIDWSWSVPTRSPPRPQADLSPRA